MAVLSGVQRGLMALARQAYRFVPLPDAGKKRLRFFLKTRLGLLFGRRRSWSYARWVKVFDTPSPEDALALAAYVAAHPSLPRFSVLVAVPADAGARRHAAACLRSLREQLYDRFDTIVCGPGASAELMAEAGFAMGSAHRIPAPGTDAAAWLRAGVSAAQSPWLAFLRHDAALAPDALALLAGAANDRPDGCAFYGDEDSLVHGKRRDPIFKPEFNLDLLLSQDYLGPLVAVRRGALEELGGIREGSGAAAAYEVVLRLNDRYGRDGIRRVPFVLSHRQPDASSGSHALLRRRAAEDSLKRRQCAYDRVDMLDSGDLRVRYRPGAPPPLVTLIVPTRDRVDLLRTCLTGLLERTDYPALEVVVVDNQSRQPATLAFFRDISRDARVRILAYDAPFNFSRMNNLAAQGARGTALGLINNDIAVISPEWLTEMVSHALRPGVGAVGAKLLYGDGTIQHAGIVLGLLGLTGHVHRHEPGDAPGPGRRLLAVQECSAVTGACLVVRRNLYLEAGGLDETMPVSCSDAELCLRLARRGHRTLFTPHATLYHLESVTRGYERSAAEWAETRREEAVLRQRWGRLMEEDPCYSPNLSLDREQPAPAAPPRVRRPWHAAALP
jgi:GT2 family glycosyltransferase